MKDILILPPELRRISKQLLTSAQKIGSALQAIDNDILILKGSEFLGHSADSFQSHYTARRQALLKAKEIVTLFAGNLQAVAEVFEHADTGAATQNNPSPSLEPGSVLGTSTSFSDSQRYNELLTQEKAQRSRIEAWIKQHPELEGWTLEEVNQAVNSIWNFIASLRLGILDMYTNKDIDHLLMRALTDADENYIKSSEANIEQMERLLRIYDGRKALLLEKTGMEEELAALQGQKDTILAPYLNLTDSASRKAWVDSLPRNMTLSIYHGPSRTITNAPLQIPARELDRDSYTAILNQFVSNNENPRYTPETIDEEYKTYCDVYVRDVLKSIGVTVSEKVTINRMAGDLNNNPQWEIVTGDEAQLRANAGIPAIALMDKDHCIKKNNIHVAMIAPSDEPFDPSRGPQVAQAGDTLSMVSDNTYVYSTFGSTDPKHVVYYALKKP